MLRHVNSVLFVLLLSAAAACSSHDPGDDDDDDTDEDAKAGSGAGRGGSGGRGGAGGATSPGWIRCGSKQCPPPANLLAALPFPTGVPLPVACCVDTKTEQCGSRVMEGAMCEPAAIVDARCPGVDLSVLDMLAGAMPTGETMIGCCTPNNQCGLDGFLFGRGCVSNEEAQQLLGALPGVEMLITFPQPRACDAPPLPEEDAGTEDAGS